VFTEGEGGCGGIRCASPAPRSPLPPPPSPSKILADILLQGAPPLKDLLDPDVELVEPDEAELRAQQGEVLDLASGGVGSSAVKPPVGGASAAKFGSPMKRTTPAKRGGGGGEEEEDIVDLT
jgi:hypothetical protein